MSTSLLVSVGQYSSAGRKKQNEDCCGAQIPLEPVLTTKGVAIAIADGMSGSEAGGEASHAAVRGFLQDYYSTPESWTVKKSASKILSSINQWLSSHGQRDYNSSKGMVTTFSALVIKSTTAYLFHIGDCRISLLRDGHFSRETQEHRVVISGDREYLSRAMGIGSHLDIDYKTLVVEEGDIFVISTDGVHDFVASKEIVDIVNKNLDNLDQAAISIGELAYAQQSNDNISCQVIQIKRLGDSDENEFFQKLTLLPFPPELEPGMILDGYKILREIHATKHIQVYLALDTDSGQEVVLKTPSVNFEDDPVYIDMFVHEEWIGKRIKSPHVMKVCEANRKRNFLYYVAEYLAGQTLRQWMDDHRKPKLTEVRAIIGQVISGLRAFHRLDMVHQDLKPENIIIDRHGTVKIIDFGSTKVLGLEEINTPIDRNTLIGTLDFIAPEYFLGKRGSNQSDIYSLGVITYQMLTGRLPYNKPLIENKVRAGKLQYTPAAQYNNNLPDWVDAALKKAVHPDPDKRYALLSEYFQDIFEPNDALLNVPLIPLIDRSPLAFWRGVSLLLFLGNIFLVYLLLG
ncbi:MAG: bifunctional protein-serine/threonine kinase/phosphatase [Thiothrix sp.]|nr:MAG: bifunctional protein-serine/threonine kinase/phosphatase [Thiothrix sp.]